MEIPDTRYAVTDDGVHIAYQVVGDGPIDIVLICAFVTHVELFWELPSFEQLVRALSSFARVILFDKRGVGLSDRLSSVLPTIEEHYFGQLDRLAEFDLDNLRQSPRRGVNINAY